jgi:hypothetical protein
MSEVQFAPTPEVIRAVSKQVRRLVAPTSHELDAATAQGSEKDNYRKFAEELATNHKDAHAHLTYRVHWLYKNNNSSPSSSSSHPLRTKH